MRILSVLKLQGRRGDSRAARVEPVGVLLVLLAPLASLGWSRGGQEGARLSGAVRGPDGPLEGAVVAVAHAKPREGVPTLCSSCYPDCRRQVVTDAEGHFVLEDLDPELEFQLLVRHPGYAPAHSPYLDPARGSAVVELEPSDLHERPPERVVRGRVRDADDEPIQGATIRPYGRAPQGRQFGTSWSFDDFPQLGLIPGVDPLAVTDENGEFELGVEQAGDRVLVRVEAPSCAPTSTVLSAGEEGEVKLVRGTLVTGVVVKDGQPLAGVEVGLGSPSASAPWDYSGDQTIGTDESGRFTFVDVPPGSWRLYGRISSFGEKGWLIVRPVHLVPNLERIDVGHLPVEPSWTVSGRVVLSDGEPVRGGSIVLQPEGIQDTLEADLPEDGSFRLAGVPGGRVVCVMVRVEGEGESPAPYVVSTLNASYDWGSSMGLLGTVSSDVEDLVILMDPYEMPPRVTFSDEERFARLDERGAPLRGVQPDGVRKR